MIKRLLIANRGEIACRIIETCKKLGVETVAVYSEADAKARHVRMADRARLIGPAPAAQSYLVIEKIIDAAKAEGADAIHPGYGFLSERAPFAEACAEAGITFVGPPAAAIEAMGDKAKAKALMGAAGVPLTPGYHGEDQADETLAAEAAKIGFPVLVKASAGGGGRGMRIVEAAEDLQAAIEAARREAESAFGDGTLLLERYLGKPRHVEVQVMADGHGNVLHLWERDCSIQRRHQKVIEEAPAPNLSAETRQQLLDAAVAAARAIDYRGAGTCEFLVDEDGSPYFIEMNTRIQVEHPVTEMITGLDLIELQLRVASGEALPLTQDEVRSDGHAIEARLYAEDPARGFLPQTGRLDRLAIPSTAAGARVDRGVSEGDEVTVHYDPMIAKVIAHAPTRQASAARLADMLARAEIAGVRTNIDFLGRIARHASFLEADLSTRFIETHEADLMSAPPPPAEAVAAALAAHMAEAQARLPRPTPPSPWDVADGFRMNMDLAETYQLRCGEQEIDLAVVHEAYGRRLMIDGEAHDFPPATSGAVSLGERQVSVSAYHAGADIVVGLDGQRWTFTPIDPAEAAGLEAGAGSLSAPMPGKIVRVEAKAGGKVKKGDPLVALEAMKMEHVITAPAAGVVSAVNCAVGDQVEEGVELVTFEADA